MHNPESEYPAEAYAEDGVLWWELEHEPGGKRKFGAERKIAAWLAFNRDKGETFTMRDLRDALGTDATPNADEHLNRRMRRLRADGWEITSNAGDKSLPIDAYRIDAKGWHPGQGPRPKADAISKRLEREVFERDGYRCVICGVGRGEPYPGKPDSHAVITVGHRQAREHKGSSKDPDNLETQCKPHNEPVREELLPESLDEVLIGLKRLKREELEKLETWLSQDYRSRDRLDVIHDRARSLSPDERQEFLVEVRKRLGR